MNSRRISVQRVTIPCSFTRVPRRGGLASTASFLSTHLTWLGMLKASALLTVLWSSWAVYSWLTNAVPAEEVIPARLVIFAETAAMFVASLAVPDAFGEYGVLFGLAYFVVFLLQVVLFALATGGEPEQRRAILRLARRRTAGDYPVRGAVWRRRALPPGAQRLQAARGGQLERSQADSVPRVLGAHPGGGVGPLPHHPRRPHSAAVRASCLRDGDLPRVSA
jgi:hypothetical protein